MTNDVLPRAAERQAELTSTSPATRATPAPVAVPWQALVFIPAGLQIVFSRRPFTPRRVIETLFQWLLMLDLGTAVAGSRFRFKRSGARYAMVAGIGSAGLLGLYANATASRRAAAAEGRRRSGSPMDLDMGGVDTDKGVIGAVTKAGISAGNWALDVAEGVGSFAGSFNPPSPRRATEPVPPSVDPRPISAWDAFLPMAELGVLIAHAVGSRAAEKKDEKPAGKARGKRR